MRNTNRKGFTLVEIMIVVVIIGLLAAMAIPAFNKIRESATEKTLINDARQISSAAQQYFMDEGVASVTYGDLESEYFDGLSTGVTIEGGDTAALAVDGTFQLNHPNVPDGSMTFLVDTGKEEE